MLVRPLQAGPLNCATERDLAVRSDAEPRAGVGDSVTGEVGRRSCRGTPRLSSGRRYLARSGRGHRAWRKDLPLTPKMICAPAAGLLLLAFVHSCAITDEARSRLARTPANVARMRRFMSRPSTGVGHHLPAPRSADQSRNPRSAASLRRLLFRPLTARSPRPRPELDCRGSYSSPIRSVSPRQRSTVRWPTCRSGRRSRRSSSW